ncbi:MAG TPA: type II toxin-antitoxin system VapC family toxin [Thermoanaerobacterales bacterium]|jgi:predicted nucleic acid-binding protein|nr:type II toxin-antitoxin system VapC family toxin [Thermoanaerobacterales bacterium]
MSNVVCIDSSIIVKLLTWEEGSEKARILVEKIIARGQKILMPDFAITEIGSVLRKKTRSKEITIKESEELWNIFLDLKLIRFISSKEITEIAWNISVEENLPTLYDATFLAVAKMNSDEYNICEFWTADKRLFNSLSPHGKYYEYCKQLI